jgi:hypothetical protein
MAVVINNFEAVADDNAAQGSGSGGKAKSPVTSNARNMRMLERMAARRNRLRAS